MAELRFVINNLLFLALVFSGPLWALDTRLLKEGDIIFQQSRGPLTPAIREATGSPWTHVGLIAKFNSDWHVFEAHQSVQVTPLQSFIGRHPGAAIEVKRLRPEIYELKPEDIVALKSAFQGVYAKPYDTFFEWSDERFYCSELTYKLFLNVLNLELGQIQRFKDLRLDGPEVQKLIREKQKLGHEIDVMEPIITPLAQYESTLLETVQD